MREADQVVHHYVEPKARRHPVGGHVAHVSRREAVIGELRDIALGQHLGLTIGRDRRKRGCLIEHVLPGLAVQAA
jgi:hypothetical protein